MGWVVNLGGDMAQTLDYASRLVIRNWPWRQMRHYRRREMNSDFKVEPGQTLKYLLREGVWVEIKIVEEFNKPDEPSEPEEFVPGVTYRGPLPGPMKYLGNRTWVEMNSKPKEPEGFKEFHMKRMGASKYPVTPGQSYVTVFQELADSMAEYIDMKLDKQD